MLFNFVMKYDNTQADYEGTIILTITYAYEGIPIFRIAIKKKMN